MKKIFSGVALLTICLVGRAQIKIGSMVPEISLPDLKDSMVNLSSYKGNVVLIDFWASWCGPCRAANPGVVKIYNKYKSYGFVVFGVSVDKSKADWLRAVKKDKITYVQVLDNAGWNSQTLEKYNVSEIPTTFLLDKEGKLYAIDATGKKLEKLVKNLLQ
jgi:peroxiredoxin